MNKLLKYRPTSVFQEKTTYYTISLEKITYHIISLKEITHHASLKKITYYTSSKEITHHTSPKGEYKTTYPFSFLEEESRTNYTTISIKEKLNTTYLASSSFFLTIIDMIIILFIMLV